MGEQNQITKITPMEADPPVKVSEFAKRLGLNRTSAYKLVANEPGVLRIHQPGSKKPIIRVPLSVIERIARRSAISA